MKKVFIVIQRDFQDGGFGDCVESSGEIVGVFTTKDKALKYIETLKPFTEMIFQFGSGICDCEIIKKPLN